ncbi:hypothetical protein D3C77_555940 [compost metagenome]
MQQYARAIILHRLTLQALPDIYREGAGFGQSGGERLDRLLIADASAGVDHMTAQAQPLSGGGRRLRVFLLPDASTCNAAQLHTQGL